MAAKSDGAAVSLENDIRATTLPCPDNASPPWRTVSNEGSLLDCYWTLCALLVFFSDGASDLWLAADYYLRRDYWWFALTLVFIIIPSVVVQVLSFRWFMLDYSDAYVNGSPTTAVVAAFNTESHFSTKDSDQRRAGPCAETTDPRRGTHNCCRASVWLFQVVVHVLQLAQVWRYVHALYLDLQRHWSREHKHKPFYWRMMFERADINMLRLLETFTKTAPQLVLQLSIMVQTNQVLPLQGLCAFTSLVSLGWMMASYQKTLRDSRDDKLSMPYKAAAVHMLWHLFTVGARAMAFALFVSVFQVYFGVFIVAHWCAMTFWIIQGETDFCMSKWEEIIYNIMVGVVYIFCWFSVHEGPTRGRLLLYSLIVLGENVALTTIWYIYRGPRTSDFYAVVVVCVVTCSYALGTFFMFVYYCLLHPDGPMSGTYLGCCDVQVGAISEPNISSPTSTFDAVSSPPRTLQRVKPRDSLQGDVGDVFKMRTLKISRAHARRLTQSTTGTVIRIDLPRKQYPAWDAHFIDRRLRKTILLLEGTAPVTPTIQYHCFDAPKEVMEYETTV